MNSHRPVDAGRRSGWVLWFTGLSGSGKTTLARALEGRLAHHGWPVRILDGDELRCGLSRDLGFSAADRQEHIRRTGEVARICAASGMAVLVALISPCAADRAKARAAMGNVRFFEIHVHADLAVCEERDPKGLYRKARSGAIRDFTGIDAPYEAPVDPDLRIETARRTVAESVEEVVALLRRRHILDPYASQDGGGI